MENSSKNTSKNSFSLFDSIAVIVGIVVGSGIFIFPGLIAMNVPSGELLALVWFLGGVVSFVGALCYAELATTYPNAGGDYHFLSRSFGKSLSFVFAWTRMMVIQPGSIVMMSFVVGKELSRMLSLGSMSDSIYALIVVISLTFLNMLGVKEGKNTQKILTTAIVLGLLVVSILGIFMGFSPEVSVTAQPSESIGFSGFGMAMVFVLLTFGGWNEAAYISSEVKNLKKTMVRSLLAGIGVITLLYLLINFALYSAVGIEGMKAGDAYHQVIASTLGGSFVPFISLLIIIAALSTTNVTIITGARSNYALGVNHSLFRFMGFWDEKKQGPFRALLIQGCICILLILLGTFYKSGLVAMVDYTSPAFWLFFMLTGVSLLVLRHKDKNIERPFKVPLYPVIPLLFIVFCAYMLRSSLIYTGKNAIVSVIVIALGVVVVIFERYLNKQKYKK